MKTTIFYARVLIFALVLTLTAVNVRPQAYRLGTCPYQKAQPNFNYLLYNGIWFEKLRYDNILQAGYHCDNRIYLGVGGLMAVTHARWSDLWGLNVIYGTMTAKASPTEAKFDVRYPALWNVPNKYWILETDYLTYSINWACSDIPGIVNRQYLWVYTRAWNASDELISKLRGIVAYKGLSTGPLIGVQQTCLPFPAS